MAQKWQRSSITKAWALRKSEEYSAFPLSRGTINEKLIWLGPHAWVTRDRSHGDGLGFSAVRLGPNKKQDFCERGHKKGFGGNWNFTGGGKRWSTEKIGVKEDDMQLCAWCCSKCFVAVAAVFLFAINPLIYLRFLVIQYLGSGVLETIFILT